MEHIKQKSLEIRRNLSSQNYVNRKMIEIEDRFRPLSPTIIEEIYENRIILKKKERPISNFPLEIRVN